MIDQLKAAVLAATALLLTAPLRPVQPQPRSPGPDTIPALPDSLAKVCSKEAKETDPSTISLLASMDSPFVPSVFCFKQGGQLYVIGTDGTARRGTQSWQVPVDSATSIEGIYYARRGNRLYLMYQLTDGEAGIGYLFAVDARSAAPQWTAPLPISINLSPPLLTDSVGYFAGLDVVEKIDLRRGALIWRHVFYTDEFPLNGRGHYIAFRQPRVSGDTVFFPEATHSSTIGGDTLVLRASTGEFLAPDRWKGRAPEH